MAHVHWIFWGALKLTSDETGNVWRKKKKKKKKKKKTEFD